MRAKRILCAAFAVMMTAAVAGCGGNGRQLYNEKLTKYIETGDYKGITVDTSSDEYAEFYNNVISSDVYNNDLYVKKTEGTVADGDTVNIDYVGKKDGVAFDGGTAEGYDLEIGSDSFIDGFEDGLIGVAIGSTVDLNLTFPESYQSTELAGKAVVFTVTVNYVKTDEERKPEDYYKELGFALLKTYTDDVTERAIKNYLLDKVVENTEIKGYPEEDTDTLYNSYKSMLETNIKSSYGIDLATYLSYNSMTEDDFKSELIENQIKPAMDEQMVTYFILDNEKLEITDEDIEAQLNDMLEEIGSDTVTATDLKDFYGDYYFEMLAVNEKAVDFLYKNAKIS